MEINKKFTDTNISLTNWSRMEYGVKQKRKFFHMLKSNIVNHNIVSVEKYIITNNFRDALVADGFLTEEESDKIADILFCYTYRKNVSRETCLTLIKDVLGI